MMKIPLIPLLVSIEDFMLPCMNKKLFGIDCPGCGMQRSAIHLVKGEFEAAFDMYPAIYGLVALVLFVIVSQFVKFRFETQIKIFLGILTGTTIIINYILKMNHLIH
ncbi:DUF2752 domain-containing protein [Aurantibacter sp.]|uniref:DUF2752 domain-containing protein n=1 Tax=Aurantibacter sp. TaxID=2807103 RepID=UPI0032670744